MIDEIGYDPMTRAEASLLFRLPSYRCGRGTMMLTTNKAILDWPELIAGDVQREPPSSLTHQITGEIAL